MRYMGNKRRICKEILPIIIENKKVNQYYVEPFVGSASIIQEIFGLRLGSDNNYYLIELLKAIQNNWIPPSIVTEKQYSDIKLDKEKYPPELVGFVGFCCSFGGKFFGGICRGTNNKGRLRNFADEQVRDLLKQAPKLKGIEFRCCDYWNLQIPPNSLIYADPPYYQTTKYPTGKGFDHNKFWDWCRAKVKEGHTLYVSEYTAPEDFICVWQKEVCSSLDLNTGGKKNVERLWISKE